MYSTDSIFQFPSQKKSEKEKTKKWVKECIDAAQSLCILADEKIRQRKRDIEVNYDLFNDILDLEDVKRVTNPFKIKGATFPAKMQNYPIANPKINLLVGEEYNRKFDYRVRVSNEDAISEKESFTKNKILESIMNMIQSQEQKEPQQIEQELKKLEKWRKYEYQDLRELRATHLLSYLWKKEDLKYKFNLGFKDALLAGEEIYAVEIFHGEPRVRRVNPKNFYTVRSGESPHIEDSDIMIEETYLPLGKVIDDYYDELTPTQIKQLEEGKITDSGSSKNLLNYKFDQTTWNKNAFVTDNEGAKIQIDGDDTRAAFTGMFDAYGNIRVVRVVWKSMRKLKEITFYDEFGNQQVELRSENYKADKSLGEESKDIWISEWREATQIANEFIVRARPYPKIGGRMNNPSICLPPYVGVLYNTNDSRATSIMDRMKPFQYMYNSIMYRTELAFAKNMGKIAELDLSKIPNNWSMDKWMYYATILGWAPIDPFKEGKKGAAQGKLAGNFNTTGKVLDMQTGQYIQQHVQMLEYIEQKMASIVGITKEREGAIHQQQSVGGVERSVNQSSMITEPYFAIHDNLKVNVLNLLLETAKYAYRGNKQKLQYITDDLITYIFDVDGDEFAEDEYDVHVSNSSDDTRLLQSLKELAHAGLQNDKLNFSQLMDIYTTDSLSAIRRKIETAEEEALQRAQEAAQQEQQTKVDIANTQAQLEQMKLELEDELNQRDNETKILIASMSKGGEGMSEIEVQKALEEIESKKAERELKRKQFEEEKRKNKIAESQKQEEIQIKRKQANRPTTSK